MRDYIDGEPLRLVSMRGGGKAKGVSAPQEQADAV
jgi:hypothetical protein